MRTIFPLILGLALLIPATTAQEATTPAQDDLAEKSADRIVFTVTGFKNDKGSLRCGLFAEGSWLGKSVRSAVAKIEDGEAICEFDDVPAATYGISSYHDKNDNGKMDLGFMRMPKEAYATSNNARGTFGPPKFVDAKFVYDGGLLELEAKMK